MDELIKWYNELNTHKLHSLKNEENYIKIIELTSFLYLYFDNITFPQRIWHLQHNKLEIQKCEICGNNVKWKNGRGYNKTCSKECHDIYNKDILKYRHTEEIKMEMSKNIQKRFVENKDNILNKAKLTNIKKYGVENFSKTKEFIEKNKQTNIKRYGVEWYQQTDESKNRNRNRNLKNSKNTLAIKYILEKKYELIERTTNEYETKYLIKCSKCNQIFRITHNQILHRKSRNQEICTNCNPIIKFYSSAEKELVDFIKFIYSGEIIENNKSVINPYELDIYIPELKLAIEYNGLYWHSSEQKSDNYHKIKTELCEKQGIRLIHVFEDDWMYKTDIIKSILQTAIAPKLNKKIFARKCEIKEINLQDTNNFLEENHINGRIMIQTKCYGLYFNNELISLMSFRKNKEIFELQRYAIKLNHTIIGGADKIWKSTNIQNCITYCDISLFTGKIYERLGFKFVRRNKPNFMFVDINNKHNGYNKRISKQSIRRLKQGYKRENDTMPRIYNSGIDVYEFNYDL